MLGNQQLWACQHCSSVHYMASNGKVLWSSLQPQYFTSSHLAHRLCAMASMGHFGPVKEEFQDWSVPWFKQELFFIAMFIHVPPSAMQPFRYIPILPVRPTMLHPMAKWSQFLRGWQRKWRRPGIGWPKWYSQLITTCHNPNWQKPQLETCAQICSEFNMGRWMYEQLGSDNGKKSFILVPWSELRWTGVILYDP